MIVYENNTKIVYNEVYYREGTVVSGRKMVYKSK